jgi:potassium efflux system protein
VAFEAFGADTLNFKLSVFVPNIERRGRARHALGMAIDKEFRKAGIEIAFPQRDLHIRSFEAPIEVTLRNEVLEAPGKPAAELERRRRG